LGQKSRSRALSTLFGFLRTTVTSASMSLHVNISVH
jgi:hypothetical protein